MRWKTSLIYVAYHYVIRPAVKVEKFVRNISYRSLSLRGILITVLSLLFIHHQDYIQFHKRDLQRRKNNSSERWSQSAYRKSLRVMIRDLFSFTLTQNLSRNFTVPNMSKVMMGRKFSRALIMRKKKMPDRPPKVDEKEFTEVFLKGSGPGGQKIVG